MDIIIKASLEHVFSVICDIENTPKWYKQVVSNKILTEGEFGLGTRWEETRKILFITATEQAECTEFVENSHYTVTIDASSHKAIATISVEPQNEHTKVVYSGECFKKVEGEWKPSERVAKLVGKFDSKMLEYLKKHIESNQ